MSGEIKSQRAEFSGFDAIYQNSLKPELLKHETERKVRIAFSVIIGVGLFLITIWFTRNLDLYERVLLGLSVFIPAIFCFAFIVIGLRTRVKSQIMQSVTQQIGWRHRKSRRQQSEYLAKILCKFGLVPRYNTHRGDDVLFGTHDGIPFCFSELFLKKYRWFLARGLFPVRELAPIYTGCVLSFQLAAKTPESTLITRSSLTHTYKLNFYGSYQDSLGTIHVHSNHQNAFETVLCARFKAAITELCQAYESLDISCLIHENWLHIPLTSQNRFEVDWLLNSFEHPERVQKIIHEFEDIMHLLDIVLRRRYCPRTKITAPPKFTA